MPSLSGNDNTIGISVETSSDSSGLDQASSGLENLGKTGQDTNRSFSDMAEGFSDGMKKVSVATGVVGAGLALYAKSSSDYLTGLVTDSKALGLQTGMTAVQASQLLAVFQHFNIDAGQVSVAFRTLTKDINTTRQGAADHALQQEDLNNKIAAAKIQIAAYTTEINKNGDSTGKLHNQITSLNIQIQAYQKQLVATNGPLQQLHINTQNADGSNKSFNDILMNVADRFHDMPDGVNKSALAVQLFGRSGTSMIKVLDQGSQGLIQLEESAQKLGLTLTQQNIVSVTKYIQSQRDLKETNDALKISIGSLTQPIMTSFNQKLNQLAQAALAPGSPIRGLTVDVLAFGGPILGATSGMAAFLGNLASAGPILLGVKTAMIGFIALLQSPWVIAFAAAAAGVALLADHLFNNKNQTDNLRTAQANLRQSTLDLKTAQDSLAGAQLNQQGAALQVEGAQRAYNQAVKDFGPQSYEARDALYQLTVAQRNLTAAQDTTKDSQQKLLDKEREVASDKQLISNMAQTKDGIDGVTKSADGAVISINKLAQSVSNNNAVGQKINLAPLLKKAQGGPVEAGQPYLVGDNPDGSPNATSELFIPDRRGTIVPADQTRRMMESKGGSKGGLNIVQHIYNQVDFDKGIALLGFRLANA